MPSKNKVPVLFGYQGQTPKAVMVGSGATIKSVLTAAKVDTSNLAGSISLNGEAAELGDRVKTNDLIELTPKAAGGR
jgi:hypothetical protein